MELFLLPCTGEGNEYLDSLPKLALTLQGDKSNCTELKFLSRLKRKNIFKNDQDCWHSYWHVKVKSSPAEKTYQNSCLLHCEEEHICRKLLLCR
ncbi:hypothetical protein Y1Q_0019857 [Alligator mississippiensis]|uniref:Uncharacterized protein n=1 Tax=Alligator mississippiensis TaxID=8496 RepID=A0A151PFM3_ALLMI|nr:hypothetical protein Y1Q_0019857 [Alligator mississippiensis]